MIILRDHLTFTLVGNGAMEFVWQRLCSIAGGYGRRAYNPAQWDEVPCGLPPGGHAAPTSVLLPA